MSELLSVGVIKEMFEAVSEDGPRPENPVLQVVASSELQPIIGNPFPGQDTVTERSRPLANPNPQSLTPPHHQPLAPPNPQISQQPSPTFPRSVSGVQQQMGPPTPTFNGSTFNGGNVMRSRVTAFGQQVDAFYDKLEEGKVNVAKKNFSPVKNDYEIYLESGSIIEEVANRNPTDLIKFDFVRIENISQYEKDSNIDVIGRNLSVFNGTSFLVDVDIKEAKELRDWYTSREE
ncbi:19027_t:CDS:2, partial [Racocetra fulgida]